MDSFDSSDTLLEEKKKKKTALFVPKSSYSKCLIISAKQLHLVQGGDFLQVLMMLHSWKNGHIYLNARKLSGRALAVSIT